MVHGAWSCSSSILITPRLVVMIMDWRPLAGTRVGGTPTSFRYGCLPSTTGSHVQDTSAGVAVGAVGVSVGVGAGAPPDLLSSDRFTTSSTAATRTATRATPAVISQGSRL